MLLQMSLRSCRAQYPTSTRQFEFYSTKKVAECMEAIQALEGFSYAHKLVTFTKSSSMYSTMYGVPYHGSIYVVFPSNCFEDQKILFTSQVKTNLRLAIINRRESLPSKNHMQQFGSAEHQTSHCRVATGGVRWKVLLHHSRQKRWTQQPNLLGDISA